MNEITQRARVLRKNMTRAERRLWYEIRNKKRGFKFRRQYPIIYFEQNIRHCFFADFACLEKGILIEVDGEIHNSQKEQDMVRDAILNQRGFTVMRFSNNAILYNIREVLNKIEFALSPSAV